MVDGVWPWQGVVMGGCGCWRVWLWWGVAERVWLMEGVVVVGVAVRGCSRGRVWLREDWLWKPQERCRISAAKGQL